MSSPNSHDQSTELFKLSPTRMVSHAALKRMLPDVETALFFAKVYALDYYRLSELVRLVFRTDVINALMDGDHSVDLQDYLVNTVPDYIVAEQKPTFVDRPPHAEILPQLWESLTVEIATSIKTVADKLAGTLDMLPGKEGAMVFGHLARMNKVRPTIGTYQAQIHHPPAADNLVILDVSGSMTEGTVRAIINDVVGLSWKANAHLAIVSNTAHHWEPGSYNVNDVLARAEYGGTYYEQLTPLFDRQWGTVITIADYDSSRDAKRYITTHAKGAVDTVLDISLVNRPTFLAECVGTIAKEVRPLLVGSTPYVLS